MKLISDADIFLLQLEIPLETMQAAVDKLYALDKICRKVQGHRNGRSI